MFVFLLRGHLWWESFACIAAPWKDTCVLMNDLWGSTTLLAWGFTTIYDIQKPDSSLVFRVVPKSQVELPKFVH